MIDQQRLWDHEAAQSYDTPGQGVFAPEVLEPAVRTLARLADGGSAVEFAIGTGRVGIALHEAGVGVRGIELSRAMLERLREKIGPEELPVVEGSMTTALAGIGHTLVYLVFNTISNLLTQEEQVQCFRNAARHLAPGGRFVVELWVPQLRALAPGHGGTVEASEDGYLLVDTIDIHSQRLTSHHIRFDPRVDGSREARIGRTPHRYIWPSELDLMGQLAGFELEHRWADWAGAEFTAESPSHVSVYRLLRDPAAER
ncbi:methyltransferase domain-containing protein [Brachybacterium hainanense]|uniref:Methyltransferase domain-containing protein n=1 Tax=Brachybacterium hainanense TaxID=1541174 RepID=A0ABV6REH1_9MICO